MATILRLFRLDFFKISPQEHDALCRSEEQQLRDAGIFDHLDFQARARVLKSTVAEKLPWGAQRQGWVQTELRDGRFYADLYILQASSADAYRESFEIGSLADDPEDLRTAFMRLPERVAGQLQATTFIDVEPYHILVERFAFQRFCNDHKAPLPGTLAERARSWN